MNYITPFILLLNEMSPYLLLGFFIAGLLKAYVPKEKYIKHIARSDFRSVLWATLAGIPLPLCSCGVIPTGVSLYKEGASKGAVVAFFTSIPQTNVNSIAVSYSLLGLPFALMRVFVAFVTGLIGGVATNKLDKGTLNNIACSCSSSHSHNANKMMQALHYSFVEMMQDIGKWLVAGIVIAGLIAIFLPESLFSTYLNNPLLNMFIVLAIALPTYTCATSSIPMAAVLMMKGLSPGAVFVFLMAGPATNIASMAVVGKALGKRTLSIYLVCIIASAVLFGLAIDYLLPSSWFAIEKMSDLTHVHHDEISWFKTACSVLLGGLLVNAQIRHFTKH
ncbi:MAG: permease [Fibromonadales bacterium]|nr:permease [Fibromonadales bacterium]